jgi:hypothetical protein
MSELPASYDYHKMNPREYVDRPDNEPSPYDGPMQYRDWLNARAPEEYYRRPATVAQCDWCRSPIVDGEPHATFVGPETLVMHRRCVVEWMDL